MIHFVMQAEESEYIPNLNSSSTFEGTQTVYNSNNRVLNEYSQVETRMDYYL